MGRPANTPDQMKARYTRKLKQQRLRRARMRVYIDGIKNVPCADCGQRFPPVCMDFDHVRGTKLHDVSTMVARAPHRLEAEIAKCEVVCACCHRLRTQQRKEAGY